MVCIDDFAIRKGVKYATVMIDINSHKIIDMINSRDYEEVTSWLSKYLDPNTTAIHSSYGTKKSGGLLAEYTDRINECISLKFKFSDIEVMIRNQGYTGSTSLLRRYAVS